MNKLNRVFIVGHSGAGKGVLAEAIAKKLSWQFINADVMGCAGHIGRRLSDVIGIDGEKGMSQCLTEIMSHQITKNNIVVTTDESIINSDKARELLKSEFTVHLKVSTPVQVERLSGYRPLLPVDNITAFIDQLHNERDSLYESVASFSLCSDDGELEKHANLVINELIKRNPS